MVECQVECNSISEVNLPYFYNGRSFNCVQAKRWYQRFQDLIFNTFRNFYKCSFHLVSTHKKKLQVNEHVHTHAKSHTLRFSSHQSLHCSALPPDVAIHETKKKKNVKSHLPHDHEKCDETVVSIDSAFRNHNTTLTQCSKEKSDSLHFINLINLISYVIQSTEDADQRPWTLQNVMLFLSLYMGLYNIVFW